MTESSLFGELGRDGMTRTAVISPCGRYRYALGRTWDPDTPPLVAGLQNPSKADANVNDPTVVKLMQLARNEGAGGVLLWNLFAFRATDPADLWAAQDRGEDIVGPENDEHIRKLIRYIGPTSPARVPWSRDPGVGFIVCGWGVADRAQARARDVLRLIRAECRPVRAFRLSKAGRPWHPLYLPNKTMTIPWDPV